MARQLRGRSLIGEMKRAAWWYYHMGGSGGGGAVPANSAYYYDSDTDLVIRPARVHNASDDSIIGYILIYEL